MGLSMLQWKDTHPVIYRQHKLNLISFVKRTISWVGGEGGVDLGGTGEGTDIIKTHDRKFSKNYLKPRHDT